MGLYDGTRRRRRLRLDRPRRDADPLARRAGRRHLHGRPGRSAPSCTGMATYDPAVRDRRRDPQQGRLAASRRARWPTPIGLRCSACSRATKRCPSRRATSAWCPPPSAARRRRARPAGRRSSRSTSTSTRVLEVAGRRRNPRGAPVGPAAGGAGACRRRGRPVVAMAGGRAFTFRYAETEELLRAAGLRRRDLRPARRHRACPRTPRGLPRRRLPRGARRRADRQRARCARTSRRRSRAGVPTVAECAGLLYLCRTLDDAPMVGALPTAAPMTERLTLRYPTGDRYRPTRC